MSPQPEIPTLNNLDYFLYLNENGLIPEEWQGKIGVYAIFDGEQKLQFVGYSRDIYLSLRQHLVRQPQNCHYLKVQTINRPSRTVLEETRQNWLAENGSLPPGNGEEEAKWTQPIDAKVAMTEAEKAAYQQGDELDQMKLLKQVARRVEAEIQATLKAIGIQEAIRFNPKLKEQGLLDLK